MTLPPTQLTTARDAQVALGAYPPVTLGIACSQLGIRSLGELAPDTALQADEAACLGRLLDLLSAATDGTLEGYVGVLWAMERNHELGGDTPMESCRHEDGGNDARAALKRRQDGLFRR